MLKIEAGKYYKTRDGRKAYVAGIVPNENSSYAIVGVLYAEAIVDGVITWHPQGQFTLNPHAADLVSLWQDEPAELREIEALVSSESEYQSLTSHGRKATDKMQELITAVNQLVRERKDERQ